MKRTLAASFAALGLIAWADPKTAAPTAGKDAVAEEARRQEVYVLQVRAKEERRVEDIAFRLEVANQELCADRRPRLGFGVSSREDYAARVRDAAVEALRLGDGLTVTRLPAGSPAALAGLQLGDVLVSVNGEAVPTGDSASAKFAKRLAAILGDGKTPASPATLVVRRGDQTLTLAVTPVMACAYEVRVEDGSDINAFADGRTVHVLRPILRLAQTDEELALVIGHELAHNGQHHVQDKMHNARMVGLGGFVLDAVAAANGVNTKGVFTKAGMQIGAAHASVGFEAEADYVGMYYMARAGFPTAGAETFWRKMAVEAPESIFIKTDHPATPERFLAIAAASKEIEEKRAKGEPLVPNAKAGS